MQKFILEVISIIWLWALEKKTAIDISDQKLKKVLVKSKIEQQLLNKVKGQEVKEESDDENNAKAFDFVIESQKREFKLRIEGCKKGERWWQNCDRRKENGVKEKGGFMRARKERKSGRREQNIWRE